MVFEWFVPVAPISEQSIAQFADRVPEPVVGAWRQFGAGLIGDGYFRFVDPVRAQAMMGTGGPFPDDVVVLFATAMGDLVGWRDGMFLVAKSRLGEIHATSVTFETLMSLMADVDQNRDVIWDWQPYPAAQARLGVPGFEDCFMHVPLLGLGGPRVAERMQVGGLWPHVGLMTQLTGRPKFTHMLPLPTEE